MQYAKLTKNDIVNGQGVCVSFWVQGCSVRCPGCHNQSIWDFNGGKEFTPSVLNELLDAISANGITRNFSILGGEPLCQENLFLTHLVIQEVRKRYPDIKIYLWTGYYYEGLNKQDPHIQYILNNIDYLIDGPYIENKRDITLPLQGSSNQSIIDMGAKRNGKEQD